MRGHLMIGMALGITSLGVPGQHASAAQMSDEWVQHWQDDLRFIAREVPATHPNAFHTLRREEFDTRIDALIERTAELSHEAVLLELTKIISALGDGHTRVTLPISSNSGLFLGHSKTPAPSVPGLEFGVLPVRLVIATDGTLVSAAHPLHAELVGSVVERIGNMSIDEALAAVTPYVHRDNGHQLRYQLPDYLILPAVLADAGVVHSAERVPMVVRTEAGKRITVDLKPLPEAKVSDFVDLYSARGTERPLFAQQNERPFWYQVLEGQNAVYWQYNEVGDANDETLMAFTDRLFAELEARSIDKLIIDLRRNRGGNNGRNKPILHHLICSDMARTTGRLFAITGGGTFSAAMMFSVDLEAELPTVFVGTPTGSSPNHYGDSRRILLPHSGITVRVSTLYWQYSDPRDERTAIEPQIPVDFTVDDYRRGHDPQLAAILGGGAKSNPLGAWQGTVSYRGQYGFKLVVNGRDQGRSAELSIPDFGIESAVLNDVVVNGGSLTATLNVDGASLPFEARVESDRLYGGLLDEYRYLTVVAHREP